MKNYNTLYYLLFILLIMGAFASMAQNTYGLRLLGFVAIAFGVIFLYQLFTTFNATVGDRLEMVSLSLLAFIFALRVFHIYFAYVEWVMVVACVVLIGVYAGKLFSIFRRYRGILIFILSAWYLSIIFFLIAMMLSPFIPAFSQVTGAVAFVLLLVFLIAGFFTKGFLVDAEKISSYKIILKQKNKSILLLSLFFLMSLYLLLTRAGVLPELYSDEFPQSYFKLVRDAELGKEKPVNGKFKHEEFREGYKRFVESSK